MLFATDAATECVTFAVNTEKRGGGEFCTACCWMPSEIGEDDMELSMLVADDIPSVRSAALFFKIDGYLCFLTWASTFFRFSTTVLLDKSPLFGFFGPSETIVIRVFFLFFCLLFLLSFCSVYTEDSSENITVSLDWADGANMSKLESEDMLFFWSMKVSVLFFDFIFSLSLFRIVPRMVSLVLLFDLDWTDIEAPSSSFTPSSDS